MPQRGNSFNVSSILLGFLWLVKDITKYFLVLNMTYSIPWVQDLVINQTNGLTSVTERREWLIYRCLPIVQRIFFSVYNNFSVNSNKSILTYISSCLYLIFMFDIFQILIYNQKLYIYVSIYIYTHINNSPKFIICIFYMFLIFHKLLLGILSIWVYAKLLSASITQNKFH
jgi:hypothetical protein